ncbi:UNVERIFIED_CONTAM: hypothetical protein FKN15_019387 [Acipenser sinensis]
MAAQLHGTMIKMENFQKLLELKKDLIGIDNLVIPGRAGWEGTGSGLSHAADQRETFIWTAPHSLLQEEPISHSEQSQLCCIALSINSLAVRGSTVRQALPVKDSSQKLNCTGQHSE